MRLPFLCEDCAPHPRYPKQPTICAPAVRCRWAAGPLRMACRSRQSEGQLPISHDVIRAYLGNGNVDHSHRGEGLVEGLLGPSDNCPKQSPARLSLLIEG